jgi:hypothetical protein
VGENGRGIGQRLVRCCHPGVGCGGIACEVSRHASFLTRGFRGPLEGDTLIVDTVGFNDSTWLNDNGAPQSDALHLVERIRPILKGKYLEYVVTADDPKVLAKPYSYTRYYEKLKTEIMEDVCEDEE